MAVELRQLRYLLAVADAGSFTAAARRAFVTQPTLSNAIGNLESELGVTLFERTPRGAILTDDGRRVVRHARTALAATEALRVPGDQPDVQRPLRVGIAPTLPAGLVAATLAHIGDAAGARRIRVDSGSPATHRRRLATGRLDALLAVLNDPPSAGSRQVELAEDCMCLAYARERAPGSAVTPEVLHREPLIVRIHCEFLSTASRILDEWQVRPIVAGRVDSDALALELVAAGHGACLMPDSHRDPRVVAVEVDGIDLRRRVGIEWRSDDLDPLADIDLSLPHSTHPA